MAGTIREDLNWWSRETGFTVEILKSAVRRGDLKASRPSGWERGRLYVASDDMQDWLDAIAVDAGESA